MKDTAAAIRYRTMIAEMPEVQPWRDGMRDCQGTVFDGTALTRTGMLPSWESGILLKAGLKSIPPAEPGA